MRGCGRRRLEEAAKRGGAAGELRPARPGTAVQRALSRLPGLFRNDDNDRNPVTSSSAGELNRRAGRVRSRAPVHTLSAHRGDPDARLHHGDPDTRPQSAERHRAPRIPHPGFRRSRHAPLGHLRLQKNSPFPKTGSPKVPPSGFRARLSSLKLWRKRRAETRRPHATALPARGDTVREPRRQPKPRPPPTPPRTFPCRHTRVASSVRAGHGAGLTTETREGAEQP